MKILGPNFGTSRSVAWRELESSMFYTKVHQDLGVCGFRDTGPEARRRNAKGGGSKKEREEEGGKEEMAIERSKQLEKLSESRSIGLGSASITNTQV